MATDAKKHTTIAPGETPTRTALAAAILSISDAVPVATATEQAQVATALSSTTYPVGSTRPLATIRGDARPLHQLEISRDGTVFVPQSGVLTFATTSARDTWTAANAAVLSAGDTAVIGTTVYFWSGSAWRRSSTGGSATLGEWHVNIAAGSPGGQAMGPSGASTFVIAAEAYARAIRLTIQGGVFPSANGDGGVTAVPSTGAWAGGTNVHRVNAPAASYFTPYSYVFYMASLAASTALTLTLNSISSVTCGYDFHFRVEEI